MVSHSAAREGARRSVGLLAGGDAARAKSPRGRLRAVGNRDGELIIEDASARHVLSAGDSLGFGSPVDTIFANETAETCTYLVAIARGS